METIKLYDDHLRAGVVVCHHWIIFCSRLWIGGFCHIYPMCGRRSIEPWPAQQLVVMIVMTLHL